MRTVLLNLLSFTEQITLLQIATMLSMLINCMHIFTFKNIPISVYRSNQLAYRVAYIQLVETYLGAAARVGSAGSTHQGGGGVPAPFGSSWANPGDVKPHVPGRLASALPYGPSRSPLHFPSLVLPASPLTCSPRAGAARRRQRCPAAGPAPPQRPAAEGSLTHRGSLAPLAGASGPSGLLAPLRPGAVEGASAGACPLARLTGSQPLPAPQAGSGETGRPSSG